MPERPSQSSIDVTTAAWELSAERLRAGFLTTLKALERSRGQLADGYPTSSFSEHRGGGLLTPTEAAAVSRERATDLERKALRCYVAIERAFASMANTLSEIRQQEPEGTLLVIEKANDAGGFCVNCVKYGVQSVRQRAGRCDPCYVWRGRHEGADRPSEQVVAHERRRRRVGSLDRRHRERGSVERV